MSHASCGCCSPGTPQLHSLQQLSVIQTFNVKTGNNSTPLARIISSLRFGRVLSVQAGQSIFHTGDGNQSLFHLFVMTESLTAVVCTSYCNFRGTQMTQEFLQFLKAVMKATTFAQTQENSVKCTSFG